MNNILLHICCAPCACYPIFRLQQLGFNVTLYFFNHNIHPAQEFNRRLDSARLLAKKLNLPLVEDSRYQLRLFLSDVYNLTSDSDSLHFKDGFHKRCALCYSRRLYCAARFAKDNSFDSFSSSLLYSKFQNHYLIKDTALRLAQFFNLPFFYEDFRQGWQQGIDLSLQLELYRQNYCGCIFSEEERFSRRLRNQRKKFFKEAHHG